MRPGMLERTAGCLEPRNLRRLAASRQPLRSQRALHSAFWSHGAAEIELSDLWASLVRGSLQPENPQSHNGGGVLLQFLYPAKTLNYIRKYSGWNTERSDGRWARSGFRRFGHRPYTSSATEASREEDIQYETIALVQKSVQAGSKLRDLRGQLSAPLEYDGQFEIAWQQYLDLDQKEKCQIRQQMMKCFSKSARLVDAERVAEIFERVEKEYRDVEMYGFATRAYLRLRNLPDAMALYEESRNRLGLPAGADLVLSYLMSNSMWPQAFEILDELSGPTEFDKKDHAAVDALANMAERTLEAVEFVENSFLLTDVSKEVAGAYQRQCGQIIERVLCHWTIAKPVFTTLLEALLRWTKVTPEFYNRLVEHLLDINTVTSTKLAVQVYRRMRSQPNLKLPVRTLHGLLANFGKHHSILGIQQIMEDFVKHYDRPSKLSLQTCMSEFSRLGDSEAVQSLFHTFRLIYNQPGDLQVNNITPLLRVHAKRGEVRTVIKIFNAMEANYGIMPNLYCWNILIYAYQVAQDPKGVFDTFQKMLDLPDIHPDSYTFSTIMQTCGHIGADVDRTVNYYRIANYLGVRKSTSMIDALVLAFIHDERIDEAEKICEEALEMDVSGSRIRMWSLLMAYYAMRRDMANVTRLSQRVSDAGIEHDSYTYATLMMCFCEIHQPDKAYAVLRKVMRDVNVKASNFHYAIVMGGYIATGEYQKVFQVQNRMVHRNIPESASTSLFSMKAAYLEDRSSAKNTSSEVQLSRSFEIFQSVVKNMDVKELTAGPQLGKPGLSPDIAYPTMFYGYILYVFAQQKRHDAVEQIYEQFVNTLPESKKDIRPLVILASVMKSKAHQQDFKGVDDCWQLALSRARAEGNPLEVISGENTTVKAGDAAGENELSAATKTVVLPSRKLRLAQILKEYIASLQDQGRVGDIIRVIDELQKEGFILSNHNWNQYIEVLVRGQRYRQAFELCEQVLMDGWSGWARLRWQKPVRSKLSEELRAARQSPRFYRPLHVTLLYLGRAYLDIDVASAGSRAMKTLLHDLEKDCPKTCAAVKTMVRSDDDLENQILGG